MVLKMTHHHRRIQSAGYLVLLLTVCAAACGQNCPVVFCAEAGQEEWDWNEEYPEAVFDLPDDTAEMEADASQTVETLTTGNWTIPEGWEEKSHVDAGFGEVCVLRASGLSAADVTSEITCSYQSTIFSLAEYEQLREMLTNDVVYQNRNASVSTSCLYTDVQDNLFQIIADDSSQTYRDIFYYVIGSGKYFSVRVKEYRDEAEAAKAQERKTPSEAARLIAAGFVWN